VSATYRAITLFFVRPLFESLFFVFDHVFFVSLILFNINMYRNHTSHCVRSTHLSSSSLNHSRTLICRIMGNLYIQNDFVFSSSPTGNHLTIPMVCGLSAAQSPLRHTSAAPASHDMLEIGKVFNYYTRINFAGSNSGLELRTQLWLFLRAEVLSFKLALSTDEGTVDTFYLYATLAL
jgi:hypothetical protein